MSPRTQTIASRIAAFFVLLSGLATGALLAAHTRGRAPWQTQPAPVQHRKTTVVRAPRPLRAATHITDAGVAMAVAADDASVALNTDDASVATTGDAATPVPGSWPPPLLNPEADLRTAWDLALGRPESHEILFTFDDGPNPDTTPRLLDILDKHQIKAVFFVVGWRLENPEMKARTQEILREIKRRGHVIGNHTVHHLNMVGLSADRVRYEIDHTSDLVEQIIGERPFLFRSPYGSYSTEVANHIANEKMELMLWSVDSKDWMMANNAEGVAMNVIRIIGNMAGGTVLMHDTHPWSVRAAEMVFRWLDKENEERIKAGKEPYMVMDPASYLEGERARLPLLEDLRAARAEAAREARHNARHAQDDPNHSSGDGGPGESAESSDAGAPKPGATSTRVAPSVPHRTRGAGHDPHRHN